jgi:Leucine-rich repeat (LRR) protein
MKLRIVTLLTLLNVNSLSSQTTEIPDQNFEQALISLGYDTGTPDGFVFTDSINTIKNLTVRNQNISSLVGIEDFSGLDSLNCYENNLTHLDLSQNSLLTSLRCTSNKLESLNVSQNILLSSLNCNGNKLKSLNVSQNILLYSLNCNNNRIEGIDVSQNTLLSTLLLHDNNLTSLDITQNTLLTLFNCAENNLKNIDVTQNTLLRQLSCNSNELTTLDVSQNTLLNFINCKNNNITNIDVSQNKLLRLLYCYNNILAELDVSKNTSLLILHCYNNNLTYLNLVLNSGLEKLSCYNNKLLCLNIKNGNNRNISDFDAYDNPDLQCIEVDDEIWSATNWLNIDSNTEFSNNCDQPCIVKNENIDNDLLEFNIHPNPNSGFFTILLDKTYREFDLILVNELGQKVFEEKYRLINKVNLNLEIPNGIYFLMLELPSGERKVAKMIRI